MMRGVGVLTEDCRLKSHLEQEFQRLINKNLVAMFSRNTGGAINTVWMIRFEMYNYIV